MSYDKEDIRLESMLIKPKRMKISVTQEDIDNGESFSDCKCPIARAIKRAFNFKSGVSVDCAECITIGNNKYAAAEGFEKSTQEFIDKFDYPASFLAHVVHPFEFEIQEIIE